VDAFAEASGAATRALAGLELPDGPRRRILGASVLGGVALALLGPPTAGPPTAGPPTAGPPTTGLSPGQEEAAAAPLLSPDTGAGSEPEPLSAKTTTPPRTPRALFTDRRMLGPSTC